MTDDDIHYEQVAVRGAEEEQRLRLIALGFGLHVEVPQIRAIDAETVLYVVGAAYLVQLAVADFLDNRAGGQVIDFRGEQIVTRRDPSLTWGLVVIYWPDGTGEVRQVSNSRFIEAYKAIADTALGPGGARESGIRKTIDELTEPAASPNTEIPTADDPE